RSAATIAFDVPDVHSLGSMSSLPRSPNRFPQDEEKLESPKEEVEAARSMLPHGGGRSIVMPHQDHRVQGVEPLCEHGEETEADGRVAPAAVLVCDNPRQNPSRTEDPLSLSSDSFHLFVEPRIATGNPSQAARIFAVPKVVGVWGVD